MNMYRLVTDSITQEMLYKENYYWIIKALAQIDYVNHVDCNAKLYDLHTLGNILDEVLKLEDLPDDFRESATGCKEQVEEQIRKKEGHDA